MPTDLDTAATAVLKNLLADFVERRLDASALRDSYVGVSLGQLIDTLLEGSRLSRVDVDLAIQELEGKKLVATGPMKAYENDPRSTLAIFGFYSLREYIYLTELGYRAAKMDRSPRSSAINKTNVHISGGNFQQAQIGIGESINQNLNINVENSEETTKYLLDLLARSGHAIDEGTKADVGSLVRNAQEGNLAVAKPLFQRLFATGVEGVKEVAWGVITAIIAKQMGI